MCMWNVEESNVWPTCGVRPICVCFAGRYDAYAGLSAADDCGIVDGCRNGTCIRLDEGYTCDCYHGYQLDATTMTCIGEMSGERWGKFGLESTGWVSKKGDWGGGGVGSK